MDKEKIEFKKHKILGNENPLSIEKEIIKEQKEDDLENDLLEIYADERGQISDLSKIKVKKKRSFIVSLFFSLFFLLSISLSLYFVFNYLNNQKDSSFVLDIKLSAPSEIVLGEQFYYEIEYKNSSKHNLENITIEANYPKNFVFVESYPSANFNNNTWNLEKLETGSSGKIKIKGLVVNKEGLNNLLSLKAGYEISGFSSYFKKEFFYSVSVSSISFSVNLDFFSTVLVGEEYLLKFSLKNFKPFLKSDLTLSLMSSDNIQFSLPDNEFGGDSGSVLKIDQVEKNIFKLSFSDQNASSSYENTSLDSYDFYLNYKILDRIDDLEKISWQLKYSNQENEDLVFYEKDFSLSVIKSDLHLNLLVNESSSNQSIDFDQVLNYRINYANKGDKKMKDLIIMAVLESDFLDWSSLKDLNGGRVNRKTISWTSKEIPELKELDPGQEGFIDFSIKISSFKEVSYGQELKVDSYAQFTIGNLEELGDEIRISDNKSNVVSNMINSNFSVIEEIRYFDDNNIPVGSGPLPPKVGEKSSFKVYWTIKNSLHELKDLQAELFLPDYVIWENKFNLTTGEINYDLIDHKVSWNLGRLPLGIDEIKIDFDISITPNDFEYNKILILLPGSSFKSFDIETNSDIIKKTDIKTTKLEDDLIAGLSSDGRIK